MRSHGLSHLQDLEPQGFPEEASSPSRHLDRPFAKALRAYQPARGASLRAVAQALDHLTPFHDTGTKTGISTPMDLPATTPTAPRTFSGLHCEMTISRPVAGVVLVVFDGADVGEFGDAPFRELARDVGTEGPVEISIDARHVSGASIDVSGDWAQWMNAHRGRIQRLHILCATRFMEVTAGFVQRFTRFGSRMRIHTEPAAFDNALQVATGP